MTADLRRLHPHVDEHTRMVIDEAAEVLGFLRGCRGPFLDDPAVRLHLFESLHQQLCADLLSTILDFDEHGYTRTDLDAYLTRTPPPRTSNHTP